jgi:hypothetical protein
MVGIRRERFVRMYVRSFHHLQQFAVRFLHLVTPALVPRAAASQSEGERGDRIAGEGAILELDFPASGGPKYGIVRTQECPRVYGRENPWKARRARSAICLSGIRTMPTRIHSSAR